MLTVHHLGVSQSERIIWLCEELGIEYALKVYRRRADNNLAPDDYKALHPMGIAPVITDGDLVLGESGAICDYLNARHGGRLAPAVDDPDFADHLFWFHWSNATYMTTMMIELGLKMAGATEPVGFVTERSRIGRDLIERRLADAPFFGGRRLTTADIMMVFALTTMQAFGGETIEMPATRAYLERIRARPAYQRMSRVDERLLAEA